MPVVPRNLHAKYWLNVTEEKGVINVSPWLPWKLSYHSNSVVVWCLSCQGTSIPNIDSIWLKKKVLAWLPWQLSYHSNEVAGWWLSCQGISMPNIDSIWLKKKELLRFCPGCYGNWVTIATLQLADACHAEEPPCQLWTQHDERKGVIKVSPWLPWQLSCHNNVVDCWCLSCQGTSMPNTDSIWLKKRKLLRFHSSCHGNWVTIAIR